MEHWTEVNRIYKLPKFLGPLLLLLTNMQQRISQHLQKTVEQNSYFSMESQQSWSSYIDHFLSFSAGLISHK